MSVPFENIDSEKPAEKFKSVLFLNTCQSFASVLSSLLYIVIRKAPGAIISTTLGLTPAKHTPTPEHYARSMLLRCLQCAVLVSSAAPFGFAALNHISYPTMVLGKSCKLVPVMLMNVLLYRRKFALYKYLVVSLVTIGISIFMGLGDATAVNGRAQQTSSAWGLSLLLINLLIDGATNSTQDEIFSRYRITGQQMMFWLNLWSTVITACLLVAPLPYIPVLHPSASGVREVVGAMAYIRTHPSIITPLVQFAITGSLGQLFIFETLQHFGSLTLVYVPCLCRVSVWLN